MSVLLYHFKELRLYPERRGGLYMHRLKRATREPKSGEEAVPCMMVVALGDGHGKMCVPL